MGTNDPDPPPPDTTEPSDESPEEGGVFDPNAIADADVPTHPPADEDPDPPPAPPPGPDDNNASAAPVAKSDANANTLAPQLDPVIDPPMRVIFQFKGDWAPKSLRPSRSTNGCYSPADAGMKGCGDPNNWSDNGCFPVAFTMVARWWNEDFPTTTGKVVFPNAPVNLDDPRELCKAITQTPLVRCATNYSGAKICPRCPTPLPSNAQPSSFPPTTGTAICNTPIASPPGVCAGGCGTDHSTLASQPAPSAGWNTYVVDPDLVKAWSAQVQFESMAMKYTRYKCKADGWSNTKKTAQIKASLAVGPVLVNMCSPGHWVVVTGYRGGVIYICDPGAIICKKDYFKNQKSPPRVPTNDSSDPDKQGYVTVTEDWLNSVINIDELTFPTATGEGENAAWFLPLKAGWNSEVDI